MSTEDDFKVDISVKMLRETFCVAQNALYQVYGDKAHTHAGLLQKLIDECDRHRPLGSDGKHGNRHTETCGCEDKGPASTWERPTVPPEQVIHGGYIDSLTTFCYYQGMELPNPVRLASEYSQITCKDCLSIIEENT